MFYQHFTINKQQFKLAYLLLLLPGIFLSGCKSESSDTQQSKIAAKVGEHVLYENDLNGIYGSNFSHEDSVIMRKSYIENWIKEQLVFDKALLNLNEAQKNKDDELQQYYHSLIKFEYEKALISQKLNKNVSDAEIEQYYEENKKSFTLDRCIIRLVFVQLDKNAPDINKVRKWYVSDKVKDRDLLHSYCIGNAEKFFLDDRQWFYYDDIISQVPLSIEMCNTGPTTRNLSLNDSNSVYFVSIKEFRKKGTIAPLEFEKERVRQMILHKRKIDLIHKIEDHIFSEALEKNYFTIYENHN